MVLFFIPAEEKFANFAYDFKVTFVKGRYFK